MSEFIAVGIPDGQPSFKFHFLGEQWHIWAWIEDSTTNIYQLSLAKVVHGGDGYKVVNQLGARVTAAHNSKNTIQALFSLIFLPRVVAHFEKLALEQNDTSFPEGGTQVQKFNWFIKNALSFEDGVLVLDPPTD